MILKYLKTDQLELYYNSNNISICQVIVHLKNNQLHVKRPWNSNETMNMLIPVLCKQFKLPATFETDLRFMLMAESMKVIEEHFVQRNIPIQARLFEDLLNIGGTREKFAAMIDRDNKKLFTNLNITPTMNSAEVLLAGLEAQESKWTGYVYHFTHLENAANILISHSLKARSQLLDNYFKDSAAENVIKATRSSAKNYVRFYFRPLTPTQLCHENLGSSDLN